MIKKFIKDSGIYGISGLITRGISIFLVPLYTRALDPNDYGMIDMMSIVGIIIGIMFPLEITQAIGRFYPQSKDRNESKEYASTAFIFTVVSLILFLIISFSFSSFFNVMLLEDKSSLNIYLIAVLSIFGNTIFYFFTNQLRWRLEPSKVAIISILYSLLTILFSVIFVLVIKWGVYGVFLSQFISSFISNIVSVFLCKGDFGFTFNYSKLKKMLAFSVPLVFSSVGVFFLRYVDRIFIKGFLSLADLGIYGIGYRFASTTSLLMQGFTSSITPLIYKEFDNPETPVKLEKILKYYIVFSIILTGILSIFAKEYIRLLTTPQYYSSVDVIPLLVIGLILFSFQSFFPGLFIGNKTKIVAIINVISAVVNVGLNIILIPQFGIIGTALAMLCGAIIQFIPMVYYSQKYFYVPHKIANYKYSIPVALIIISSGYYLSIDRIFISLIIKFLIFFALLLSILVTGMVTMSEIKIGWFNIVNLIKNVRNIRNILSK